MARRKLARKLPGILLVVMALVLIHSAHAPLMKSAGAATDVADASKSSDAASAIEQPAKAKQDTGEIQMLLNSMANGSPVTPPHPWDYNTFPQVSSSPISLIPNQPDGTTINPLDGSESTPLPTGPGYTIPPTYQSRVSNGDAGLGFDPGTPTVTTPTTPHKIIVTGVPEPQSVPEPTMISVLIGGWMMARRTPRNQNR